MMEQLIKDFPLQMKQAMEIGENATIRQPKNEIRNITVSGLGGSGIGGTLVKGLVDGDLKVPFMVNKGYFLPEYINKHSLVIISSYSGNTEETYNAMQIAQSKGAHIICVTSGGKIENEARTNDFDLILIPGGNPPRACLGYSSIQLFYILNKLNLIPAAYLTSLNAAMDLLNIEQDEIQQLAKGIAKRMVNKIPIVYAEDTMEAVAIRFRQQINENSKMLCWHHALPEMNHNELVGWRTKNEAFLPIFLRSDLEFPRNAQRAELNKVIINDYVGEIIEIVAKGKDQVQQSFYLIHLTDWVSEYLGDMREMDTTEVKVIDFLKGELAKQPF